MGIVIIDGKSEERKACPSQVARRLSYSHNNQNANYSLRNPGYRYVQVPETASSLDWAGLKTLDLAKYDLLGGKQELAVELTKAIEDGFFYVENYGLSKEEVDAQFGLAKRVLPLPNDEKQKYRAALEQGDYNGWKPAEHAGRPHPEVVRALWHTIERFSKHAHYHIFRKLPVIFAVALGLKDEEWLVKRHHYDRMLGDHLRYMKYYARSEEEN
ncbi:hypothetical protein AN6935.2 [Aspergillus nidulans FGSC A4]|uniref:Non-haem dioxygenase N-terminal domain-containing protein n=1 Tax=Emericella nidulans (strain FGSC A4 / ATCC 38163 / CBS 112.46 / NRRL 194 / M139) TaxID=227321 RepID=Q5AXP5_EMENI|nr:hypothetical protein [Aspergillus nidulans FGSC A4]EAA57690.1 hypothetical protein AN6935.2 [Aspergillus nidulans FGSC A4]CBF71775.1 TPA: conserved hypothetical protein [Aspergillus nidulans FGSC A4]|eukprot:XP_664539.1 hypothetical protein AN6935.2 [Aspergillus nidulans FGSC A4]